MSEFENFMPFENRLDLSHIGQKISAAKAEIKKVIVGQDEVLDFLFVSILAGGHSLIEGVPGVAKTVIARLLARTIDASFSRIQFTPDLMPSDVTGTSVLDPTSNKFEFVKGPVFANIVLIDEINRAPAKTQASLFECMSEKQVTADGTTYILDDPFLVLATQNPIDHEGTYRLPEAQLDRFLFKIIITYPSLESEITILKEQQQRKNIDKESLINKVISREELVSFQAQIKEVFVHDQILAYIANIVSQTRENAGLILGASPRASLAILDASRALAAINGRDFVTPEDVKYIAHPIIGHRVLLTPEREMEGFDTSVIVRQIIDSVETPH